MLSLPMLQPSSTLLPHQHHYHARSASPPPTNSRQQAQQQHRPGHRSSSPHSTQHNPTRSSLAILASDESAIQHRKAAIRNFGALWIRPPGVPKTLQAMTEEAAELAEAEEQMRQEQGLRDMAASQQVEEARQRAQEAGMQEDEAAEGEERDLDADVPDADADDEESDEEVMFNESSIVEGSGVEVEAERYAAIEEAELTGAAREMEELGLEREVEMERDLDDSVPEAGSYQHTDTEVEDSSSASDSELNDSFAGRTRQQQQQQQQQQAQSASTSARRSTRSTRSSASAQRPAQQVQAQVQAARLGGLQDRIRAQVATPTNEAGLARSPGSLDLSSSVVESSMVGSSPVAQRGARGRAGARRRGRMS